MNQKTHHPIFLLAIFSVLTTLIKYEFGVSDQLTQLPLIFNELSADYLLNDFFVNANRVFGPRFYYSKLMALGAWLFSFPLWFFLVSVWCAFGSTFFTYMTVFKVFNHQKAALLAGIFVLVLPTPTLAESTFTVYEHIMTPTALVFPLLLAAFYRFFTKKEIIVPLLLAGIASLFQSLYGLTTGLLLIWAYLVSIWRFGASVFPMVRLIIGAVVLFIFGAINLYPYFTQGVSENLSSEQFIAILAYFRTPHHYIPSTFPLMAWLFSLGFFGAAGMTYFQQYRKGENAVFHLQVGAIAFAILCGFVCGYVWVEVFPVRLFTTAQLFRYVILLKWLAIIYLAVWLSSKGWELLAALHPISLLLYRIFGGQKWYAQLVTIAVTLVALVVFRQREDILVLVALALLVVFILQTTLSKTLLNGLLLAGVVGLAVAPFISQRLLPASVDGLLAKVYPKYDFAFRYDDDLVALSAFIEENTPKEAIFITPPDLPDIRFAARRAIVVDFKSFPFQDNFILEWKERIDFCYGATDLSGFAAQRDLTEQFKKVEYSHLQRIKRKYGANYAILDPANPIMENVVFENAAYKMVGL